MTSRVDGAHTRRPLALVRGRRAMFDALDHLLRDQLALPQWMVMAARLR